MKGLITKLKTTAPFLGVCARPGQLKLEEIPSRNFVLQEALEGFCLVSPLSILLLAKPVIAQTTLPVPFCMWVSISLSLYFSLATNYLFFPLSNKIFLPLNGPFVL